jgi:hypothetical protein
MINLKHMPFATLPAKLSDVTCPDFENFPAGFGTVGVCYCQDKWCDKFGLVLNISVTLICTIGIGFYFDVSKHFRRHDSLRHGRGSHL